MRIKYQGYEVDVSIKKFMEAPAKVKKDVIKEIVLDKIGSTRKSFIDYWFGFVDVNENHITSIVDGEQHESILSLTIITGRKREGQFFSNISKQLCEELIESWGSSKKKWYHLRIDLGVGAYQDYVFNQYQKKILICKLMEEVEKEWYEESFTN